MNIFVKLDFLIEMNQIILEMKSNKNHQARSIRLFSVLFLLVRDAFSSLFIDCLKTIQKFFDMWMS